jgi:hypothetical protein
MNRGFPVGRRMNRGFPVGRRMNRGFPIGRGMNRGATGGLSTRAWHATNRGASQWRRRTVFAPFPSNHRNTSTNGRIATSQEDSPLPRRRRLSRVDLFVQFSSAALGERPLATIVLILCPMRDCNVRFSPGVIRIHARTRSSACLPGRSAKRPDKPAIEGDQAAFFVPSQASPRRARPAASARANRHAPVGKTGLSLLAAGAWLRPQFDIVGCYLRGDGLHPSESSATRSLRERCGLEMVEHSALPRGQQFSGSGLAGDSWAASRVLCVVHCFRSRSGTPRTGGQATRGTLSLHTSGRGA